MENLIPLKFLFKYGNYMKDTVAAFPKAAADRLISLGIASPYAPDTPKILTRTRDVASKMLKKGI